MDFFPLFGFIDLKTFLVIGHLFGVALGAGGALFSAAIFFQVIHDGRVNKTELTFLNMASVLVTVGLGLLILTGLSMFLLESERYLASTKFLAKMTIIGILAINGFLIHQFHLPILKKYSDEFLPRIPEFRIKSKYMYIGGAVSMTSWSTALVLGVLPSVPYSYGVIMAAYGGVLIGALGIALTLRTITLNKK
jgi:hypothetical protein